MTDRRMVLGAGQWWPGGEHLSAWRHSAARPADFLNVDYYVDFAKTAERGKFDTIFFADELYVWDRFRSGVENTSNIRPEPFTLLGALAMVTEKIGLTATLSTTYNEPYHAAREIASIDFLSKGRAGWNLVTSASDEEARNFGRDTNVDHAVRYERGLEFVQVVQGLWDSWDDDALLYDKESGRFADADKVHALDHRGKHFQVRGPLNMARPPQGYPVLFSAGGSPAGRDLAAATGHAIFTMASTLSQAQDTYADVKRRTAEYGRAIDDVKVLPMVMPIVGATEADARAKAEGLLALTPAQLALDFVAHFLEIDLTGRDLDEPLRYIAAETETNQSKSIHERVARIAADDSVTLRQVYSHLFYDRVQFGTPTRIADYMQERFDNGGADGFIIMSPHMPAGLTDFVDDVIPVLQSRGLFRTEYEASTLRGHLGLDRPASRYCPSSSSISSS